MALTDQPSNPMNFTENQHGNAILEKLKIQKEQGRFCDVTLHIDGKKYKAHRNVLASCSPYFDSVLKMHKTVKEGLTITCQNPEVFHCLLNYMYTGSIVIDKNNVGELLSLANHFLVAKLRNYCAEYLDRYLDVSNCLSVREMAEKYNMPSLMKAATLFIQVNVSKVICQEEIACCPLQKIEAFLSEKSWVVPQSIELLGLITRWVNQDINVRERSMKTLLSFVDWHAVAGKEITEHIDKESLYSNSDVCLYFILQSLVENDLLFPKYREVYQTLQEKFSQNGTLLDDFSLNMAVSKAIDDLQRAAAVSNDTERSEKLKLQTPENMDKSCSKSENSLTIKNKIVLSRRCYKQKLVGIRPGARLAALKVALASRRRKLIRIPNNCDERQGGHSCHLCSHMALSLCLLEEHLSSTHSKDVSYKCGICGYVCQWNKDYLNHMKEHFQGPPFKCESCKFTCDHINALLAHRLKHTGDQPYNCEECDYECSSRTDLMSHKQCHLSPRHPYKCDSCGKQFIFKSTLEKHLLTHGNDRPYLCDTCGFSTKYLSILIAHKRIHSGDVFRCQFPDCKYTTSKKFQLSTHAYTHAEARPYSCSICSRGFLEKSHLVRHERIHLDEKPFKCSQCDYASSRRDKLKEHCSRHHHNPVSSNVLYKSQSTSESSSRKSSNKNCQENTSGFNTASSSSSSSSISSTGSTDRNAVQCVSSSGDLQLMMQHQLNAASSAPPLAAPPAAPAPPPPPVSHLPPPPHPSPLPAPPQQTTYPSFSEAHHPALEFHHHHHPHQLLNSRSGTKSESHNVLHHQLSSPHHMLPPTRTQHQQNPAAAVAAMMLDPRFHHGNPATAYHPAPPPVSMAAMVVPGGGSPNQGIANQHHQGDYPCMPLF